MKETVHRGRTAAEERSWVEAYQLLSAADREQPLDEAHLEHVAFAAYMIGKDDEMVSYLERAHRLHLDAGRTLAASRAGIWIGLNLALRGALAPASGWFGRSQRLVEKHARPCPEAGYLLVPGIIQNMGMGDFETAAAIASEAIEIGNQFDEPELIALALHGKGRALVRLGRVTEGLGLLDEAMVAVTADDLAPMVTGIIYCSVIEACYEVQELRRAHSWTEALSEWCGGQTDLVAFTGQCLTHRAELMQLRGEWERALVEAQRAGERFFDGMNQLPAAQAHYRQGEVHRLRGQYRSAENAYRAASEWGWPPQPGLALLRLSQGKADTAKVALVTALEATDDPVERARLLPAMVKVAIDAGDLARASEASGELDDIAAVFGMTMIGAAAHGSRGALLLELGSHQEALDALRKAREAWLELGAPYEIACVRLLIGRAYTALGDSDSAELEFGAARSVFERLGAQPDLSRLAAFSSASGDSRLTRREVEVLRLVARGNTNRAIAEELFVSNRTIDRHLSNIYTKLGVGSRTAAAAYAFDHGLM